MAKKRTKKEEEDGDKNQFLLVGIGASAGGIQALKDFFQNLPDDNPQLAFVVIMHLSEQYESQLDKVIQAQTKMLVQQVKDTVKVQANQVYVIPPGKHLVMIDGTLALKKLERADHQNVAVDRFFRTLADTYKRHAVGIVFSGTGNDGSLGLRKVKEQNGITIAQDPQDATFDGMPQSAIDTGFVDFILPAADIPDKIIYLQQNAVFNDLVEIGIQKKSSKPQDKQLKLLKDILILIRLRTANDFSHYKTPTLLRRIGRQMQFKGMTEMQEYLQYLRDHPEELEVLVQNLLINVTSFFRDQEAFEQLEEKVIPELLAGKTAQDSVRVWVAACATGEEAYSIAMLLAEQLDKQSARPEIQIIAGDLSKDAINTARQGRYLKSIALDISDARLKRFFIEEEKTYRIREEIREMILFTQHNILGDPPFLRMDLVSCRNFMIYLDRTAQEKVLRLFHFALHTGRFLFLGSSESAESKSSLFSSLDRQNAIFQSLPKANSAHDPFLLPTTGTNWQNRKAILPTDHKTSYLPGVGELHHRLIELYGPPSVLVDQQHNILHLSEKAGRFFKMPGGKPSHHILEVALPSLRPDLRTLLFSAQQYHKTSEIKEIKVQLEDKLQVVDLIAQPVIDIPAMQGFLLILFKEHSPVPEAIVPPNLEDFQGKKAMQEVIGKLEQDLSDTKEQLRATVEQYETLVEELKASNEELYAVNEEMRSTTEELETSKEELQSVNEELKAVNSELKEKVEEVSRSNSNLQNLMVSTDIPTIFLKQDLSIQLYTPAAQSLFNVIASDIGRPIAHITHELQYDELTEDATQVLQNLQAKEREIKSNDERYFMVRILPYRTTDDRIDGVVLTFVDITDRKRAEEAITDERLRLVVEASNIGIWELDVPSQQLKWSDAMCDIYGIPPKKAPKKLEDSYALIHPEDRHQFHLDFAKAVADQDRFTLAFRILRPNDELRWLLLKASVERDNNDQATRVRGASLDLTELKQTEALLRTSEKLFEAILHQSTAGIARLDLEGKVMVANLKFGELFDDSQEGITDKKIFQLSHPDARKELREQWQHSIENGEDFKMEMQFSTLQDKTFWGELNITLISDQSGEWASAVATLFDITERQRVQQNLLEVNQRKSDFLALLSHELRNPLTPIFTAMDILRRSEDREKMQLAKDIMSRQIEHLKRLISDLLDISQIQSGKLVLVKKHMVLQDAIELAAEICESSIAGQEQQLQVQVPDEPIYLYADPDRITQIIQNLLSNASKYSDTGKKIRLVARVESHEVSILVSDDGIGIDPDHLSSIFDMFVQIPQKKRDQDGIGVGLSLVKQLVEMHGGRVMAESDGPNTGSKFVVWLPLAGNSDEIQVEPIEVPAESELSDTKKKKILIVDDNPDIVETLKTYLEIEGLEVQVFSLAKDALEASKKVDFSVAVLDIGLPDMDGYQLAEGLRKIIPEILLIAYSGWGQAEDRQRSKNAGFDHHLVKPVQMTKLMNLIARGR